MRLWDILTMKGLDNIDSLLVLMSAGLLPKDLTEEEVQTLKEHYGEDWFSEMGYDEWETERSKYDSIKLF